MKLSEREVFNHLRAWVRSENYNILQLVSPGGQAAISLTLRSGERPRVVVPDLIAASAEALIIGELKPGYSQVDHDKVVAILDDPGVMAQLLRLFAIRFPGCFSAAPRVEGVLCHSDLGRGPVDRVSQWVFHPGGCAIVAPADLFG